MKRLCRTIVGGWMYLSFADKKFLGAVIINARDIKHALKKCYTLGINPGGQVLGVFIPADKMKFVPDDLRNKLLSKAEVQRIWPDAKTIREHEQDEKQIPRFRSE